MSSLLLALAIALGQTDSSATGPAEPAGPARVDIARSVKSLVTQLDDDELSVRDQAEAALLKMGPAVIELLPVPDEKTPLEVKARLSRIRIALEKVEIDSFTQPSKVGLQGEIRFSEALSKIEAATGNKFIDLREQFGQEAADPRVKLELDDVPYWKAIDTLFDAAEMEVYNFSNSDSSGRLPFVNRNAPQRPRLERGVYSGLFRLEAVRVQARRDLRSTESNLEIGADLSWEPRIRPIVLLVPQSDVQAVGDDGSELAVQVEGTQEIPIEGIQAGMEMTFSLALPPRTVKKVSSLKTKFLAVIPGRVETFEFRDLAAAKNVSQERGGAVLTLEQSRRNDDLDEIRIRLRFDKSSNALESHRGWIYNNECFLLDAAGNRIESGGSEARLVEENEVGLSFFFDLEKRKLSDCRFVYKTPAQIYRVPVEFELTDIELP